MHAFRENSFFPEGFPISGCFFFGGGPSGDLHFRGVLLIFCGGMRPEAWLVEHCSVETWSLRRCSVQA